MSTINDDDLFLVERTGTSYSVRAENVMSESVLQDDDLFLVERVVGGQPKSFSVKAETVREDLGGTAAGFIDPPVVLLSPEDGAGMSEGLVKAHASGITNVSESPGTVYTNTLTGSGDLNNPQNAFTPKPFFDAKIQDCNNSYEGPTIVENASTSPNERITFDPGGDTEYRTAHWQVVNRMFGRGSATKWGWNTDSPTNGTTDDFCDVFLPC